jgi:histone H3/H4
MLRRCRTFLTPPSRLLSPHVPFRRLVRKLILEQPNGFEYRIQSSAVGGLQAAAESFLITVFEGKSFLQHFPLVPMLIQNHVATNLACIHDKRVTILPKDMALIRNICNCIVHTYPNVFADKTR